MKGRVNPRRRPATFEDVERAREKGRQEGITAAMAIFFNVLCDKENADKEIMRRVWAEVNGLSESIAMGLIKVPDIKNMLREEYKIDIGTGWR